MLQESLYSDVASNAIDNIKTYASEAIINLDQNIQTGGSHMNELTEKALNSAFDSEAELKVKKAMYAGMLIAKKAGILPAGISKEVTSDEAVSIVDDAFTRVKAAFKVATGELDVIEAADKIIDQGTARLATATEIAVSKGVDMAINKIGVMVIAAFPPAAPVVAVVKSLQPIITQRANEYVRKGINALNKLAKTAVRKTYSLVKEKSKNVLKSLFA